MQKPFWDVSRFVCSGIVGFPRCWSSLRLCCCESGCWAEHNKRLGWSVTAGGPPRVSAALITRSPPAPTPTPPLHHDSPTGNKQRADWSDPESTGAPSTYSTHITPEQHSTQVQPPCWLITLHQNRENSRYPEKSTSSVVFHQPLSWLNIPSQQLLRCILFPF